MVPQLAWNALVSASVLILILLTHTTHENPLTRRKRKVCKRKIDEDFLSSLRDYSLKYRTYLPHFTENVLRQYNTRDKMNKSSKDQQPTTIFGNRHSESGVIPDWEQAIIDRMEKPLLKHDDSPQPFHHSVKSCANKYKHGPLVPIVGGKDVPAYSMPWMIYLDNHRNQTVCAGVLITYTWVLTSHKCIESPEHTVYNISMRDSFGTYLPAFGKVYYFPWSNLTNPKTGKLYDLALINFGLAKYPPLHQYQPACAPLKFDIPLPWEACQAAGWGYKDAANRNKNTQLQQLDVHVHHEDNSTIYVQTLITETNPSGLCFGDTGSPLMCPVLETLSAVGIASSYPSGCDTRGSPTTEYVRIYPFLFWIRHSIDYWYDRR